MENIKEWAMSVVFSVAVAAVIGLLSPKGGGEKAIKFLTCIFLLIMFLSPFAHFEFNAAEYTKGIDSFLQEHELKDQVESQVKETLASQIISSVSAYLNSINVEYTKISVDMDIDENKNITIKGIVLHLISKNSQNEKLISDYVRDNYGAEAEILIDGVQNEREN